LDPLPAQRATTAIAQLCEHLTATQTHYPGTDLILRYAYSQSVVRAVRSLIVSDRTDNWLLDTYHDGASTPTD